MDTCEKILHWRTGEGLNQRQAAARAGISQAAWQALESGRCKRIGLDVAVRVVKACDGAVSLDDLIGLSSREKRRRPRRAA
jgi:transcriptional regulator with XRE-family HTH domain